MSEYALVTTKQESNFIAPVADLQTILNAYQVKKEFIERALRKNIDYGVVPGSIKPALLKPGAEKLANIYGFSPVFEDIVTIEDWSGADHGGEPFFYYRQKCKLYLMDRLVGSADGSCNSWEKKYRYRTGQRVCPICGQPAIFQSKAPKTGYYCWNKKGGCGANFPANDERITKQEAGQVANPDICDVINTILKMAQKRALVAAVLITTGASDYFTQDVEDFVDGFVVDAVWELDKQATTPANGKHAATMQKPAAQVVVPEMAMPNGEAAQDALDDELRAEANGDRKPPAEWSTKQLAAIAMAYPGEATNRIKNVLAYAKAITPASDDKVVINWYSFYRKSRDEDNPVLYAAKWADDHVTAYTSAK